jgi:hypothetical protein
MNEGMTAVTLADGLFADKENFFANVILHD